MRVQIECLPALDLINRIAPASFWSSSSNLQTQLTNGDVWAAAAAELGLKTTAAQSRGGLSDGNWLWDLLPTIDGLGPEGDNAHSSERSDDGSKDQEYVLASSFVPKALLNIAAIVRLAG